MKKMAYSVFGLILAVLCLCVVVDPPGASSELVVFTAAKVEQPAVASFTAAESVVLFVAAVSAVALVGRRSRLAIKTTYRAFAKTFVAVAKSGVTKLTANQRRSNSKHDGFSATSLSMAT